MIYYLVLELNKENFAMVLDIPTAPTAGEAVTLSCTVVSPNRFVLNVTTILWYYDAPGTMRADIVNPDATLGPLVKEPNGNFSRNITLDPVKTSDARRYSCNYTVGIIFDAEFSDLLIQSKSTVNFI